MNANRFRQRAGAALAAVLLTLLLAGPAGAADPAPDGSGSAPGSSGTSGTAGGTSTATEGSGGSGTTGSTSQGASGDGRDTSKPPATDTTKIPGDDFNVNAGSNQPAPAAPVQSSGSGRAAASSPTSRTGSGTSSSVSSTTAPTTGAAATGLEGVSLEVGAEPQPRIVGTIPSGDAANVAARRSWLLPLALVVAGLLILGSLRPRAVRSRGLRPARSEP